MAGLIDFIFNNMAIEQLSRSEVKSNTVYLVEILQQNLSVDQVVRYQRIKVRLNERLLALDKQKFKKAIPFLKRTTHLFLTSFTWTAEQVVEWGY